MIFIDKPFASDFLINTIKEHNFEIVATPTAKKMANDESLNWVSEENAIKKYQNNNNLPIYSNSENSISWIEKHLPNSPLLKHLKLFKNKIAFREFVQDIFPDYYFKGISINNLKTINPLEINFPCILKPAVGFFSLAVYKIDTADEWTKTILKIENEILEFKGMYPTEVVDVSDFIIEQYIDGEEYAIDCYFNDVGEAVVLNIMHHTFSSSKDVSDRVYSTSQKIISQYFNKIEHFLQQVGQKATLKNFPIHVEVRVTKNGTIIPIEVNPMRFGGWCTTGDISYFAFGFNSYQYFLQNKKPNWSKIFNNIKNKQFNLIVLDNNSGIPEKDINFFNYDLLLRDFKKPLNLRRVDFNSYAVFGFLFTETSVENENEIHQILTSNLKKYISLKE